jgi:hypothetical protein
MPSPTFAGRVHGLFALLALALLAPFSRAVDNVGVVVPTTGLSPALVAGKSLAENNRDFGANPAGFNVDLRAYFTIPGLLGGGRVRSVRAMTGNWDPGRPTEGAYSALLTFDDDLFASCTYSGYAHFDSDAFLGFIGEMGLPKDPSRYGAMRKALRAASLVSRS